MEVPTETKEFPDTTFKKSSERGMLHGWVMPLPGDMSC